MSRLYVGNLPNDVREDDLRRVFGEKAQIRDVTMRNGFAFVEFNDAETADGVRRDLDGSDFGGKSIRIDRAKPKPERGDRGDRDDRRRDYNGGGGGGYRGGYEASSGGYGRDAPYGAPGGGYGGYRDDRRPPSDGYNRYEERRGGGGGYNGGGYEDRRGGYDRYEDRRGGYDRDDRRGGYDRPRYDRPPRDSRHPAPHSSEFGLLVDGLPPGTDWKELKDHFRPMGNVCYVTFSKTKPDQGVVQFENEESLLNALKSADGSNFRGVTISVSRMTPAASSSDEPRRSPSPHRPQSPN